MRRLFDRFDGVETLYDGISRRFALSTNRGSFGLNREDEAPTKPEVKIIIHII
jgi:hypothetical protein